MGLHDRDYYQEQPRQGFQASSVVVILVLVNVAVWLVQVALVHRVGLEQHWGARPADIFQRGYLWQLVTANFLHAPDRIVHILGNMIFLYFFGREVEGIYGRRDFLVFYLAAGTLSIFAEALYHYFFGNPNTVIFGASGAVMATVVLFSLFFPQREIYLAFFIPIQAWLLCVIFVLLDLFGALGGGESGIAFFAHLTGAAFGLVYRFADLRLGSLSSRFRSLGRFRRRGKGPRLHRPQPVRPADRPPPRASEERDPVSVRIDQILEKISRSGRGSLTPEELEYLQENSKRYRSGG
jgi:membrane associated rhomboid family serine protease